MQDWVGLFFFFVFEAHHKSRCVSCDNGCTYSFYIFSGGSELLKEYIFCAKIARFITYFDICPDHVISTGRQMMNLLLNFEYLLLLCFLTVAESGNLVHLQAWFWVNWTSFRSDFNVGWKKIKTNIQNSTLNLSLDALLKWHDPHIT